MPKLLIAATVPRMLEAFLLPYACHYRAQGWTVDCAASGASASPECRVAFDNVWDLKWSRNPFDLAGALCGAKEIRRLWQYHKYDLVHVHSPIAGFVIRLALRNEQRAGLTRIVYTAHGFHFHEGRSWPGNLGFRFLEDLAGQWTDCLIVLNRDDERAAHQLRNLSPSAIRYMPGIGIDLNLFDADRTDVSPVLREWQGRGICPGRNAVFLVVAEFIPRKRHADVLKAFAQLPAKDQLVLAGSGPLMEAMKNLAAELGIHDRVHFLGQRRDIAAIIRVSDAVVLVSEQEGLPRSIMEAFALQTPVIASDIRGNRDLLRDGRGLLVPVGNVAKIGEAMQHMAQHPEETRVMIGRSREYIEQFRIDHLLAMHDELYGELLSESYSGAELRNVPRSHVKAEARS
ncbi:MAG TPA: glycosyltransferase [Terriglobales bacterium]|nr:glycosyltransferase [Terriglobales bacterium]